MRDEDFRYFRYGAKVETGHAQKADEPAVANVHHQLAALYVERAKTVGQLKRVSSE